MQYLHLREATYYTSSAEMKQRARNNHQPASSGIRQEKILLGRYFVDVTFDIPEEKTITLSYF